MVLSMPCSSQSHLQFPPTPKSLSKPLECSSSSKIMSSMASLGVLFTFFLYRGLSLQHSQLVAVFSPIPFVPVALDMMQVSSLFFTNTLKQKSIPFLSLKCFQFLSPDTSYRSLLPSSNDLCRHPHFLKISMA